MVEPDKEKGMPGNKKFSIINIGLENFLSALQQSGTSVSHVTWHPPAHGDTELTEILYDLTVRFLDDRGRSRIDLANEEALRRILAGRPVLKRVLPAHQCIPVMQKTTILHAGPPIHWNDMCLSMRGAIIGALKYEGLAESSAEAEMLMDSGKIFYGPTHPHATVCPMAGIVSYSMPLLVVENEPFNTVAYSTLNEGQGHVLSFGANTPKVINQLYWLKDKLAPALDAVLVKSGGINLYNIMARALLMGDEMHQRNIAASMLFFREIYRELDEAVASRSDYLEIMRFLLQDNAQFFLNLAMAACRSLLLPTENIPYSSMITSMSRNGVTFGVTVSALGGKWFTAPSLNPKGIYFPGYTEADANLDMGDSSIVECCGLGGLAMGASPALAHFFKSVSSKQATLHTEEMTRICVGTNPNLPIPDMDFAGVPTGIDIRKIVATGILPTINSGLAHRLAGVGQVGIGIATPPMEAIYQALRAFHASLSTLEQREGNNSAAR